MVPYSQLVIVLFMLSLILNGYFCKTLEKLNFVYYGCIQVAYFYKLRRIVVLKSISLCLVY